MLKAKAATLTNVPAYSYSSRIEQFFRLKYFEDKGSINSTGISLLSDQRASQQLQINLWRRGKKRSSGDQNTRTHEHEI